MQRRTASDDAFPAVGFGHSHASSSGRGDSDGAFEAAAAMAGVASGSVRLAVASAFDDDDAGSASDRRHHSATSPTHHLSGVRERLLRRCGDWCAPGAVCGCCCTAVEVDCDDDASDGAGGVGAAVVEMARIERGGSKRRGAAGGKKSVVCCVAAVLLLSFAVTTLVLWSTGRTADLLRAFGSGGHGSGSGSGSGSVDGRTGDWLLSSNKRSSSGRRPLVAPAHQHVSVTPAAPDGRVWSASGPCGAAAAAFPFGPSVVADPTDPNAPPHADALPDGMRRVTDVYERAHSADSGVAVLHTVEFARFRHALPGHPDTATTAAADSRAYPLFGTPEGEWQRYCTQVLSPRLWPECRLVLPASAPAPAPVPTAPAPAPEPEALWLPRTQRAYIASVRCAFVDGASRHLDLPGTVFDATARWFGPQPVTRPPKVSYSGWLDPNTRVTRYPELASALGPHPCAPARFVHDTLPRLLWLHWRLPARVPLLAHRCVGTSVEYVYEHLFRTRALSRDRFVWHSAPAAPTVSDGAAPVADLYFADTVYTAAEWPFVRRGTAGTNAGAGAATATNADAAADSDEDSEGASTYYPAELMNVVRRAFVPFAPATASEFVHDTTRRATIVVIKRSHPPLPADPLRILLTGDADTDARLTQQHTTTAAATAAGSTPAGAAAATTATARPPSGGFVDGGLRAAGLPARALTNHDALVQALRVAFPEVDVRVFDPNTDMIDAIRSGRTYDPAAALQSHIALFSAANVVIGAHGSALGNVVYCPPGAVVVEIGPEPPTPAPGGERNTEYLQTYYQLAVGLHLDYYMVLAKGTANTPLTVDVAQLVRVLTHGGVRHTHPAVPYTATDVRFKTPSEAQAMAAAAAEALARDQAFADAEAQARATEEAEARMLQQARDFAAAGNFPGPGLMPGEV